MEHKEKRLDIYKAQKKIIFDNLLGGVGWAIGASLGFSLLLTLVSFILTQVNVIPVIGNFAAQLETYVEQAQNNKR